MDDPQYREGRGYFDHDKMREVAVSEVLPGLEMAVGMEALGRSQIPVSARAIRAAVYLPQPLPLPHLHLP